MTTFPCQRTMALRESNGTLSFLATAASTKGNGHLHRTRDMDAECRFGQMARPTKASGRMTKLTGAVGSYTLTAKSTMASGKTTWRTDTGFICTLMGPNTRGSGSGTNKPDKEKSPGPTELATLGSSLMGRSTEKGSLCGEMEARSKVSSKRILLTARESTSGQTDAPTQANGRTT